MIKLLPPPLKKLITLGLMLCPLVSAGQTLLHLRNGYYIAAAGDIAWHNPIKFADEDPLISFIEQDYDVGLGISTAFGMTCSCWRLEFEGAYRKSNLEKIETAISSEDATGFVRDFTLMVNGYWDVYVPCSWWIFYLGGGLGVSFQERQTCSTLSAFEKTSNTLFVWQGMAGFSYEIIEHVFLNAGYRLVMTAKPRDSTQHADNIVLINNLELGVRIEL